MAHYLRSGGIGAMDIDHHNPTRNYWTKNSYENLFLATRHCNGKKGKKWPNDPVQIASGIRFLNPCSEIDYGHHIFEDPDTFEVWGATAAGRYHVRMLDLNADHLVQERKTRSILWAFWRSNAVVTLTSGISSAVGLAGLSAFRKQLELMIPEIMQKKRPTRATS